MLTFCSNRHERHELISIDLQGKNEKRLRESPESACGPHCSSDGKFLAFTINRGGKSQILIRRAEQGLETDVSNNDFQEGCPAWSPDGKRLAFQSNRNGNSDIWVMNRDGTELKVIASDPAFDADPAWSADGKQILFCSTRAGQGLRVFVADVDGPGVKELIHEDLYGWVFPDMGPDCKQIACGGLDVNRVDRSGNRMARARGCP